MAGGGASKSGRGRGHKKGEKEEKNLIGNGKRRGKEIDCRYFLPPGGEDGVDSLQFQSHLVQILTDFPDCCLLIPAVGIVPTKYRT